MKKYLTKLLPLSIIILVGIFLRIYQFGTTPVSMNWDEVAISYNAWSVAETGRDEYGKYLPMVFQSFDDYKPPLYIYTSAVLFKIFGPVDNLVRVPALVLGILSILGIYLLTLSLFNRKAIALMASFFVAIMPWSVHFSRVAFEGGTVIFFITFGTYFFQKFTRGKTYYLLLSVIFFGLGLYSYHSVKIIIPLIVVVLVLLYKNQLKNIPKRKIALCGILALFFVLPIIYGLFFSNIQKRYEATNIFSSKNIRSIDPARKLYDIENGDNLSSKIFHNINYYHSELFIKNFLSHFSPDFLFFTSDNPRHHPAGIGLLFLAQLPLILLGFFHLIKNKFFRQSKIILISFMFIFPLASAVTLESPHSVRSSALIIPLAILSGLGVFELIKRVNLFKVVTLVIISFAIMFNFYYFFHQYFVHTGIESANSWQYGRKEAATYSLSVENNYDEIWVSNKLEQSYIYWLFYQKIQPKDYLISGGTKSGVQGTDKNGYGKYRFINIDKAFIPKDKKILLIGLKDEFSSKPVKQILSHSNQVAIDIVENDRF